MLNVRQIIRDITALLVVGVFLFPICVWAMASIKAPLTILDEDGPSLWGFTPTWLNYAVTVFGAGETIYDGRGAILNSIAVACGATLVALATALPMAYALSQMLMPHRRKLIAWLFFQRLMPPVVIVIPLVAAYHGLGLMNTRLGVMLAHAALNLPIAVLMLKSFFDDLPPEVSEAAMIDGATRLQILTRILMPMLRTAIAATAVLVFIFSWTEFMMAVFLTTTMHTVPVQASVVVMALWGFVAAFSTAALVPAFIFILFVQKHLVRGLTMGLQR